MTDTINIPRAELQAALDAIDEYYATTPEGKALIETLRARLAQQEEKLEPVAIIRFKTELRTISGASMGLGCSDGYVTDRYLKPEFVDYRMHYPQQTQFKDGDLLYAAPPQRPWQGLTEQDTLQIRAEWEVRDYRLSELCRAIEAKLKEKNK